MYASLSTPSANVSIGLIPTFETIGWLAPLLLLLCRLLQGMAISGEYTGAIIYVAEQVPQRQRGFYTGFIQSTVPLGLLLCLVVVFITRNLLGNNAFETYGWRLPFFFRAILIVLSYLIRARLPESPLYVRLKSQGMTSTRPVRDSFRTKHNRMLLLLAVFGGCAAQSKLMQTTHFVALFFLQRTVLLPSETVLIIVGIATLVGSPLLQFFGGLSDKIGRKPLILSGSTPFITELLVKTLPISMAYLPFVGLIYPLTLIFLAIIVHAFAVPETYRRNLMA